MLVFKRKPFAYAHCRYGDAVLIQSQSQSSRAWTSVDKLDASYKDKEVFSFVSGLGVPVFASVPACHCLGWLSWWIACISKYQLHHSPYSRLG